MAPTQLFPWLAAAFAAAAVWAWASRRRGMAIAWGLIALAFGAVAAALHTMP